jgi:alanine racemase
MKEWLKTRLRRFERFWQYGENNPLIVITISRQALLHNMAEFRRLAPDGRIAPVLKSNAYGHGLVITARALEKADDASPANIRIPFFVIDSYFEARVLRRAGIRTPLLIIGYTPSETIIANRLKNVRFTVGSLETLRKLALAMRTDATTIIHLKIDTGMRRQGILPREINEALTIIAEINSTGRKVVLEGCTTHFSDADNTDTTFTDQQIAEWNAAVEKVKSKFPSLTYWHASNTAGHGHPAILANVSRLGIGLYGIADGLGQHIEKNLHLKPVLEMTTIISGVKHIKKGESVGYSRTYIAPRDMTIATIPVGYFEGVDRRLSNKGFIKIRNAGKNEDFFAPIIGRVSMNITIIDITEIMRHVPQLGEGYPVTVISAAPEDKNSLASIARLCNTIPYEIVVHIPAHLKRILT